MSTYVSTPGGKPVSIRRNSRQGGKEKSEEVQTPKTKPLDEASENETWTCDICNVQFTDPNAKILECQRCTKHYCIGCLNKPVTEYKALRKSDSMWFCMECKIIIEKSIVTDLKIEERCKEIMQAHESRISSLEERIMKTCDEKKVKDIIQTEIQKSKETEKTCDEKKVKDIIHIEINKAKETEMEKVKDIIQEEIKKIKETESVIVVPTEKEMPHLREAVIEELNSRKARENNLVIYGLEEVHIKNIQKREDAEYKTAVAILQECGVKIGPTTVKRVTRMGKYREEGPVTPKEDQRAEPASTAENSKSKNNQGESTNKSEGDGEGTKQMRGEGESSKKARPRPMLVVLEDQKLIPKIFKMVSKLKDGVYSDIQIANDLSLEERNRERELHQESKRRQEGDKSGKFLYRVRGPPWARKVARIPKRE